MKSAARKSTLLLITGLMLVLSIGLSSCRNETQNKIRRSLQDFTSDKMYISLYSLDGTIVFESVVDGKVTRSSSSGDGEEGSYVFWFDDKGRYHQSNLPYLVTSYNRNSP